MRRVLSAAALLLTLVAAQGLPAAAAGESPTPLIVGGEVVPQGELPSLVFVAYLIPNGKGEAIICTGSVIAPQVILTAAHCLHHYDVLFDLANFRIFAGAVNWKDPAHRELRVDATAGTVNYEFSGERGDIGLLHLTAPAELPSMRLAGRHFWSGDTPALIAGWGKIHARQRVATYQLHRAETLVRSPRWCRQEFVPEGLICTSPTKGLRTSSCFGDSGGPLLIRQPWDGRRVIAGVLHGGFGCNRDHGAHDYVPVNPHLRWIRRTEARWERAGL